MTWAQVWGLVHLGPGLWRRFLPASLLRIRTSHHNHLESLVRRPGMYYQHLYLCLGQSGVGVGMCLMKPYFWQ